MNHRDKYIESVFNFLVGLEAYSKSRINLDWSISVDSIVGKLLNLAYGYNLVPVTQITQDIPGIDLIDSENSVAVQITVTHTRAKISETLRAFSDGQPGQRPSDRYHSLIIFIIDSSPLNYTPPLNLSFPLQILNIQEYIRLVQSLPVERLASIVNIMLDEGIPGELFTNGGLRRNWFDVLSAMPASEWQEPPASYNKDTSVLTADQLQIVRFACLLPRGGIPWELFLQFLPESCRDELPALVRDGYLIRRDDTVFVSPVLRADLLDQVRPTRENCAEFLDRLLLYDRTRFWQRLHFLRRRGVLLQLAGTFGQAAQCLHDPDGELALRCAAFYAQVNETSNELQWSLRAVQACEAATVREPWSLGNSYLRIADCYQRLGDNVNSFQYCKKMLSLCEEGLLLSAPDLARVHYQTGLAQVGLGNHSAALKSLKRALDYSAGSLMHDHPMHSNIHNMLSISNRASGNIIEARESKLQSVRGTAHTWSPTQSKELVAKLAQLEKVQGLPSLFQGAKKEKLCFEIGDLYHAQGDYPMALDYHMQALELREKRSDTAQKDLADSYHRIGMIFRDLDDHNEAMQYLQEAERIRTHSTGIPEADLVCTYLGLGSVYSDCGMYQYALENLTSGLALQKKLLHPHAPELADTYTALGSICRALGKDQDAQKHYSMAVNIRQVTLPETHPDLAGAYMNSANARIQLSQHRLALRDAQRALDTYQTIYPAGHPQRITAQQTVSWLEELTANS